MSAEVAKVLRDALVVFGPNGEKWSGLPAQQADGMCAWGGIFTAIGYGTLGAPDGQAQIWAGHLGFASSHELFRWNDAEGRTFAEVKELFEKAIAKAEAA